MGIDRLNATWWENHERIASDYREWDERREAAIPDHLEALNEFLEGSLDVEDFRSRIDSLTKSAPYWGFRGTSQMFFNQLVKAMDSEALEVALKAALPAPTDVDDAFAKLAAFVATIEAARESADAIGATRPGIGRADAFVTFFWELQDRENWPTFFPNSRNVLEQEGLLEVSQPQPQLYLDYREEILHLKEVLETGTWGVEHLLWFMGQGKPEALGSGTGRGEEDEPSVPDPPPADLYTAYRRQGLFFPDEVVTSLVLSLATKRLVILSGISGTGKTQIALGLGRYLEGLSPPVDEPVEPPESNPGNLFLRLSAPNLRRGFLSLATEPRRTFANAVGLPERGTSKLYETRLPDGARHQMRLNNIGFENTERNLFRLYFRKDIAAWLQANAKPGDFLHLEFEPSEEIDLDLSIVPGSTATASDEKGERMTRIAVRSDWTDPRGLIGYFNPLTSTYVRTTLVDLLLHAGDDPERPYLVVLDEMNLARVEYYFSDFLSALECDEPLTLMSPGVADENAAREQATDTDVELPATLEIPPNVSFVGTVNVDETTHPFSPKVLDRANVIEFSEVEVERALGHGDEAPDAGLRLIDGTLDPAWLCTERKEALAAKAAAHEATAFTEALEDVHGILTDSNRQFGYRVIDEISGFVGHALEKADGEAEAVIKVAFDLQLRQKVIPKLSGGRELEVPLAQLLHYCLEGKRAQGLAVGAVRAAARQRLDRTAEGSPPAYPGSARKLARMLDRLADTGFVGALD